MALRLLLALALLIGAGHPAAAQTAPPADAVGIFLDRLRDLALKGDTQGLAALSVAGSRADDFVRAIMPAPASLVIKERDRTPLPGGGQRLLLEIFRTSGDGSGVYTWQMDLSGAPDGAATDPGSWRIARLDRLSLVSGLYRLALDQSRQYDVHDLTLNGPDLTLHMPTGTAFVATTPEGPTAIVLLGRGRLQFSPPDPSEHTQIAIFSGNERLDADFDAVLVRSGRPTSRPASPRGRSRRWAVAAGDARRAAGYFDDYIGPP